MDGSAAAAAATAPGEEWEVEVEEPAGGCGARAAILPPSMRICAHSRAGSTPMADCISWKGFLACSRHVSLHDLAFEYLFLPLGLISMWRMFPSSLFLRMIPSIRCVVAGSPGYSAHLARSSAAPPRRAARRSNPAFSNPAAMPLISATNSSYLSRAPGSGNAPPGLSEYMRTAKSAAPNCSCRAAAAGSPAAAAASVSRSSWAWSRWWGRLRLYTGRPSVAVPASSLSLKWFLNASAFLVGTAHMATRRVSHAAWMYPLRTLRRGLDGSGDRPSSLSGEGEEGEE